MLLQMTKEIGQEIIARLSAYTDVDMNIMDMNGIIVASTDSSRLDHVHIGAVKVIEYQQEIVLYQKDISAYPGTKPGVNLPIMYQRQIKGVVGVSGQPGKIKQIAGIVRATAELVLEQIHIERETYFIERRWNNWIHQLLHPLGYDEEQLLKEATYTLEVNPSGKWRMIVMTGFKMQENVEGLRAAFLTDGIPFLFVLPFMNDEIVIAADQSFEDFQWLIEQVNYQSETMVNLGIGHVEEGIKGLRDSYHQAKQALDFAKGEKMISNVADWPIERIVASVPESIYSSICSKYYQTLYELGDAYFETIETYMAYNFSLKATADALHIHRNTLQYRLDQIKEKTGLDPRTAQGSFLLQVVLTHQNICAYDQK
ncbi:CdaR family transcriptional regulator [Lentibacillus saliphilus]|uniref:CdaR family transcriptional regulator n=1 Tax=Lentibacillus saliphilus TaxID=2737028 RepID=UPI001C30B22C|nr:sugar diacid recognition domain-containing protein [Lentibacillus saliphilus]